MYTCSRFYVDTLVFCVSNLPDLEHGKGAIYLKCKNNNNNNINTNDNNNKYIGVACS